MKELNQKLQAQFEKMCLTGNLFRSEVSGRELWDLYLQSFDNDPVFRDPNSSTHNCNTCNSFFRRYGNIVSISKTTLKVSSIFDIEIEGEFKPVVAALSAKIKASRIADIFVETFEELKNLPYESCKKDSEHYKLGLEKNFKQYTQEEASVYGVVKPGEIREFNHIHLNINRNYINFSGKSPEAIMGEFRDSKNVFQRAMETISADTLNLVKDLINQGSLLDGKTHLYKVEQMIAYKDVYDDIDPEKRENWCWDTSYNLPIAKFRNELIGVLCTELSEGEELNKACQSWNKRVDPANYMKAVAPITERQKELAKVFVQSNGFEESFNRRFATIDDIRVSEILHSNIGEETIKNVSIFDNVKPTSTRHKRSEFDGVEEVSIEKFMKDILPSCTSIEAFLSNNHEGNMVSLTTSANEDSKPIFKWDNNYSWTFKGNLAGKSQIKEAVKDAGGRVDGVLRFSMIWNDSETATDGSDLDAWCKQPDGVNIGYSTGYRRDRGDAKTRLSGQLDLDNTSPSGKLAIENIWFSNLNKMRDGVYKFWVHQFSARNSKGFKVEIEFDGEIYTYVYDKPVSQTVDVAEVTLSNGKFSIKHLLPVSDGLGVAKTIYGLESNKFHKVNLVCLTPNHWGDNNIGNKHYLFMLDGCKVDSRIRSFHNENLIPELAQHRAVLEVLGAANMIEPSDKQLSGLGFNATVNDELILKLQGSYKRTIKIKF
jgi:hypothetical protein